MLQTFETYFRAVTGEEVTLADHAARFPNSLLDFTPPAEGVAEDVETKALVSGGCWVARCPQEGCTGVELARVTDKLFFCCECRNAGVGHKPIKVKFPSAKLQLGIERLLAARPVPMTRNWQPGETLKQLEAENAEHGVAA